MLYLAIRHSHISLSALAVLTTLIWIACAWNKPLRQTGRLTGYLRAIYLANRILVGLSGLTGLWLTFIGPWRFFVFPYLGLLGLIGHELAAVLAKRAWLKGGHNLRRLLCLQIMCILWISWLMSAKII